VEVKKETMESRFNVDLKSNKRGEQTSYSDLIDSLRLSLKAYNIT
jgi:hypothetical protein